MKKGLILTLVMLVGVLSLFSQTLTVWSSEKQVDFMKRIGQQFTRDTGINVDVQMVTFGDIKSKFLTAAQAGEGPDIIVGAHDWVGELALNGLLEPIPISAIELNKFAPSGIQAFTYEGKLYGLPYAIEAVGLFYNRDYVSDEEVPTSIDELKALAKEFTTDETVGFAVTANDFYHVYGFFTGYGAYVFDYDSRTGYDISDIGMNNEGAIKAGYLLRSFFEEGIMPQGMNYNIMDSMFMDGLAAMIINGPWAVKAYLDAGVDFGVVPLTSIEVEPGKTMKPFVGVQGLMINSRSQNKAFAMEFIINYLATAEGIYQFYIADPRLPSRIDVSQIIEEQGGPVPAEIVAAFTESAAGGEPMPNIPAMQSVWQPMNDALNNIINGTQTPEDALNDAVSKIKAAL
ncbi:sugar ABC transporter substrate-binding protein [Petrotoga olearia]|jgi:maltose/maltodextrin transport system substrate-binding protein|uniref:Sugar ABC transporter substrate-binding protein n=2 Tax=Petrotoga olearia TaxID=156203 RepID=A0A2K1NZP0_9BACT|nr:maltose ABC transporter substrate-binding protein [Petrotoga olearia]KUK14860.1 MAG: Extracellular solute-binding protein family 1 [Petrotoga mobilis]PNR96005.1 sugar ABC transporter substrate-binding protein [Petrotoga olearia DSM 13574]RMA71414.1 maltose/maltodextrin transport system substrate-binding protein [Petrotoga olearia]